MTDDLANLSFEDAMRELESIVRDLETGKAKLDDAVRAYERGAALKAHCEGKLAGARCRRSNRKKTSAAALPLSDASWIMLKEVMPSGKTPHNSPSR